MPHTYNVCFFRCVSFCLITLKTPFFFFSLLLHSSISSHYTNSMRVDYSLNSSHCVACSCSMPNIHHWKAHWIDVSNHVHILCVFTVQCTTCEAAREANSFDGYRIPGRYTTNAIIIHSRTHSRRSSSHGQPSLSEQTLSGKNKSKRPSISK